MWRDQGLWKNAARVSSPRAVDSKEEVRMTWQISTAANAVIGSPYPTTVAGGDGPT
jgi:hypothetical protein